MKMLIALCMVALCSINSIVGQQTGNSCEDVQTADVCTSWLGLCSNNPHVQVVCKKTCGLCPSITTQGPTTAGGATTATPCYNIKSAYQCWLWRPLCKVNKTVQRLCQHRCRLCKSAPSPTTAGPSQTTAALSSTTA